MNYRKFPDYPLGWDTFDTYASIVSAKKLGFSGNIANINRFGARYHVAKCFQDASFDRISFQTGSAYTALIRLLITYSAFDRFLNILDIKPQQTLQLINQEEQKQILRSLRRRDFENKIFLHIYPFLTERIYKNQVSNYLQRKECNPFFLIGSIRHTFVHGHLAPNIKGLSERPGSVVDVCDYSSRVLLHVMDRKFQEKMNSFQESMQ